MEVNEILRKMSELETDIIFPTDFRSGVHCGKTRMNLSQTTENIVSAHYSSEKGVEHHTCVSSCITLAQVTNK